MNERPRRQHQARRQSQFSASSLNGQYHQGNNRSIYHAHPTDNYSSSNYRHPSTTTTTTNPSSSIGSEVEESCKVSICYSYLIAMFSSVLVVLGIYLSVTKFNVRYLFISLLGISIEAVGACIYCVSNIIASKSARRKQRINSDDLILNSGSNTENNILNNAIGANSNRQQQINTITHILSNRTLTNNNNNHDNDTIHENNTTAINNNTQLLKLDQSQSTDIQSNAPVNIEPLNQTSARGDSAMRSENLNLVISSNGHADVSSRRDQVDFITVCATRPLQSIKSENSSEITHCQPSPGGTSNEECLSTTVLLADDRSRLQPTNSTQNQPTNTSTETGSTGHDDTATTSQTSNLALQIDSQPNQAGGNVVNTPDGISIPETHGSADQQPVITAGTVPAVDGALSAKPVAGADRQAEESSDLINLEPRGGPNLIVVGETNDGQAIVRRSPQVQSQQRAAHLRRTLVMGLGGEEELIEVNEEDLDNMSVLPPSYESITTTNTTAALSSDPPKQSN